MKKKEDDLEQYKEITVADMNVEGMPWFIKPSEDIPYSGVSVNGKKDMVDYKEMLTPKETRVLMIRSVLVALLWAMVFIFAILLFLLFCVYVWL